MPHIFRLVETAGIEIEYCNLNIQNKFPRAISHIFSYTHDASVETRGVPTYNGIPIGTNKLSLNKHFYATTIGREIISVIPLEVNSSFEIINNLTLFLKDEGVSSKANRAGIHVHITCPPNYSILKEIFNIGLFLEAPLFYFGCMGQEFRGAKNSCSYSFPLSRPPIIKLTSSTNVPLYEENSVFESKSYSQIAERLGDLINMQGIRYSPARYAYLNYFSTLLRGSLEFRVFNLNLSPFAIDLALRLSGHITKEIIKRSYSDKFKRLGTNSVINTSKTDSIDIMESFLIDTKFDDVEPVILLMERSPNILINPKPVFSHLHYHPGRGNISPRLYHNTKYMPNRVTCEIKKPVTQQSHNIKFHRDFLPITSITNEMKQGTYKKRVPRTNFNEKTNKKQDNITRYFSRPTSDTINFEVSIPPLRVNTENSTNNSIASSSDFLNEDNIVTDIDGEEIELFDYIVINIGGFRDELGINSISPTEILQYPRAVLESIIENIENRR